MGLHPHLLYFTKLSRKSLDVYFVVVIHLNTVATRFDRVPTLVPCTRTTESGPAWYDSECRLKRSLANRTGELVTNPAQRENHLAACREYRATKQRKQHKFISSCTHWWYKLFLWQTVLVCDVPPIVCAKVSVWLSNAVMMYFTVTSNLLPLNFVANVDSAQNVFSLMPKFKYFDLCGQPSVEL